MCLFSPPAAAGPEHSSALAAPGSAQPDTGTQKSPNVSGESGAEKRGVQQGLCHSQLELTMLLPLQGSSSEVVAVEAQGCPQDSGRVVSAGIWAGGTAWPKASYSAQWARGQGEHRCVSCDSDGDSPRS